jgi:hypothetical protein
MRYQLEKYRGPATRYSCPGCGKKREFTRYIDIETGNYLADYVGKCNREINCGYHFTPKQYYELSKCPVPDRWDILGQGETPSIRKNPVSFIDPEIYKKSLAIYQENNFTQFLYKLFDTQTVNTLVDKYKIGTSKHWPGATVFWQIDRYQNIRTGKIMLYNKLTGKRVKKPYNCITWVHAVLDIKDFNLRQCLFGEHILYTESYKTIGIVESEKTAIIATPYMPEVLFLAVGSFNNFKYDILKPLKGRKIILFPDLGCLDKWKDKTNELKGFDFIINDVLENGYQDKKLGYDIADVLQNYSLNTFDTEYLTKLETLDKLIIKNPAIKLLIDKFDLELKIN